MNTPTTIHTSTKDEARLIRWLYSAASKNPARAALTGVYVKNGQTAAGDGFRLHMAPTPAALVPLTDEIIKLSSKKAFPVKPRTLVEVEKIDAIFPDYEQIIPTDQPVQAVCVNATFLKAACDMPTNDSNMLYILLRESTQPLTITNGEPDPCTAVIMPMHADNETLVKETQWQVSKYTNADKLTAEIATLKAQVTDLESQVDTLTDTAGRLRQQLSEAIHHIRRLVKK